MEVVTESDTPQAFVTETMAELYLQQGFRDEALGVYRQLLAQNPYDDNLRERVNQLESGSRSSISVASVSDSVIDAAHERRNAPTMRSVRAFFGGLAARRVMMHHAAPEQAEPEHAEPEPVPHEVAAEQPVHEPVAEAAPQPEPEAHAPQPPSGYSDEAFSDDAFGANSFTGSFTPRASGGILAKEDYGSDSLVSRVTEEVDVFGLPVRTEQSQPEPEANAQAEPEAAAEPSAPAPAPSPVASHSKPPAAEPAQPAEAAEAAEAAEPVEAVAAPAAPRNSGQVDASVNGLFSDSTVAPGDDAAASTLAGAFGGAQPEAPPERERAVRPAKTELSLDSVFREGPGESGPARRESSAFSFDQFFGSDANAENVSPIEGVNGNTADDSAGVETEQFSSWLSGLKKK